MNYKELLATTAKVDPKRIAVQPLIHNVHLVNKTGMHYTCEVKSDRDSSKYKTEVNFKNNLTSLRQSVSEDIEQIDCAVNCTCMDFLYTFANANYVHKCLEGPKPPEYQKKTDRVSKNPQQYPGICKHGIATFAFIKGNI